MGELPTLMKNRKSLKNLKQFRVRSKFVFYVLFRPIAQKMFFPIMGMILAIGIIHHEYDKQWNQDRWTFTNEPIAESLAKPTNDSSATSPVVDTQSPSENGESVTVKTNTKGDCESPVAPQVEVKIRQAFPEDPDTAVAIAKCESQLDPTRIGDAHMQFPSIGLFQINQTWHKFDTKTLQNPDENIRIAKDIKDRWGNWNAWSCYKFGFYQKYLKS